jgi:pSer/pThr/pTyr-binding forkhead associated (FHA) protein
MDWGRGAHSSLHRHTGTYVNGFSISVKTQLHPGDTITFGTGPTCVPCTLST